MDPQRNSPAAALDDAALRDLERLVRIPSIAFPGFPGEPLREAAEAVVAILRDAGLPHVEAVEIDGAPPTVVAEAPGPPGTPTVLLYAHYDVQPSGPEAAWSSPPFEPVLRDGRLYGRGAADDKSGVVMHAAALRALGDVPVGVKVVVEGEEEVGTGALEGWIAAHPERVAADVIVIADGGNWRLDEPTVITSLRGLAVCDVEVSTLERPVHSGLFGGTAPDALIALVRLLDTLHDARGAVAVAGLDGRAWDGLDQSEEELRIAAGVLDGVDLVGDGTIAQRLFGHPAITVIGLDAPAVDGARNALVHRARARVSARLAPGQDAKDARDALARHLEAAAPWHVRVAVTPGAVAEGFAARTDGPGYRAGLAAMERAYGKPAVKLGSGGSIPLVTLLDRAVPHAEILIWGAQDPAANIHSADESVDLAELHRATEAEVALLQALGEGR